MSLDGLIETITEWHFDYVDDELNALTAAQLATSDALILGRRTYEGFAEAWPSATGEVADKFNSMRKYVVSSTLESADWTNTTVIRGDVAAEIARIKEEPGQDILMYGFGPVAETLLKHGLLDEIQVGINPLLTGAGGLDEMLFRPGNAAKLELLGTRALGSGIVILSYRPLPNQAATNNLA
jgi:dihydrofolate reductase